MSGGTRTINAEKIKQAELELILGQKPRADHKNPSIWGLALSGGGIRSATFALGVLQTLVVKPRLLRGFHYISTVSGGGYIGSFLQGLIYRKGFDGAFKVLESSVLKSSARDRSHSSVHAADADDPQRPILHLREYSNYLSPRKSALSGDTLGMLGTYVRNVLLTQIQLCSLLIALSVLPLFLYPWIERLAVSLSTELMIAAAALGAGAALLLGLVTTRTPSIPDTPRPPHHQTAGVADSSAHTRRKTAQRAGVLDVSELPRSGVKTCAAAALWTLALSAVSAAIGIWGIDNKSSDDPTPSDSGYFSALDIRLLAVAAALYFVAWMCWLVYDIRAAQSGPKIHDERKRPPLSWRALRFVLATIASAMLAGTCLVVLRHTFSAWNDDAGLWMAMIFGPTCVLLAIELTGIVHLGLSGWALTDLQREVWARVGGKAAALIMIGLGLSLAVIIYGPWAFTCSVSLTGTKWHTTGWIGSIVWIVTTGSGVLAAYTQRVGDPKTHARILDLIARIAPWVFLLGLFVTISSAAQGLLSLTRWSSWTCTSDNYSVASYLRNLSNSAEHFQPQVAVVLVIAVVVWILFGYAMNLNEFSMNAFYRNRLVRCYLGASNKDRSPEPTTNFDPQDDISLKDVVKGVRDDHTRPLYPLIGTTLNLLAVKQLDWQNRKAASFCLTPGYCGYIPPPSHPMACPVGDAHASIAGTATAAVSEHGIDPPSDVNEPVAATMTLGDATAISGAAVSPNMGYHSSAAVTFLLTLFDARLGWWLRNPSLKHAHGFSPTFSGLWLIKEMLGLTRDTGKFLYLSDGGHFENLGIYELVRRRCRFILSVDASADPDRDFEGLGNAIQKCRTDFGVEITIDVSDLRCNGSGISARSCAVGRISYPDGGEEGTLLYIKPTLTGREPADIAYYARAHPSFPHETTADQFFDEAQFESYRRLGEYIAESAVRPATERVEASAQNRTQRLDVRDSEIKDNILVELQHQWGASLTQSGKPSSLHMASMSQLFIELRENPSLSILDAQIYPAWSDLASPSANGNTPAPPAAPSSAPSGLQALGAQLPRNEDFRACFYFCQELVQLMESVYHDLQLERAWDHIDNRGWMNTFRQWSSSPMFRVAWAVGSPTYARPFVTFSELRLNLPRLADTVCVTKMPLSPGASWKEHCDSLHTAGHINQIERSVLLSDPIVKIGAPEKLQLCLLRLKWRSVLKPAKEGTLYTTLGIGVLDGSTLVTFRIQDHLRRLGLATRFMHLLVDQCKIDKVKINPGYYGALGVCTDHEAVQTQERIHTLMTTARIHARMRTEGNQARQKRDKPTR